MEDAGNALPPPNPKLRQPAFVFEPIKGRLPSGFVVDSTCDFSMEMKVLQSLSESRFLAYNAMKTIDDAIELYKDKDIKDKTGYWKDVNPA